MRIAKDLGIPIFPIDSGTCVINLLISCGFETCLKNISLLFMEVINIFCQHPRNCSSGYANTDIFQELMYFGF
ncbi:hypothetical protein MSSAC_2715 [Methanosarcina siciliae C2J]|uniref:Uncharacterized protein n=1 Tax=Methanosarcina siciliae C2J TaxID=1434118 RepID=A0A0E3PPX5_9EURY|nr:hypothetical protein MSSAC_2715 [Methanosarcina siciliae C2J]